MPAVLKYRFRTNRALGATFAQNTRAHVLFRVTLHVSRLSPKAYDDFTVFPLECLSSELKCIQVISRYLYLYSFVFRVTTSTSLLINLI